jgi:hypothetical protein
VRGEEVQLLGGVRAGAEVDVVRAGGDAGELGVGVGVFDGQPAAGQHADPALTGRQQSLGGHPQRLGPRGLGEHAVRTAHHRARDPSLRGEVAEGEPALVVDPLLVDLGVVAGQPAHHRAAAAVRADRAAARTVLADAIRGHQVERPRAEPVRRAGERADRADLDRVAGEVGLERLVLRHADLLLRAALEQVDERVAGDLLREPGAALAEHAALAVQKDLRGDRQRLGERPLLVDEPGVRAAGAHRLVLQRAFATLVADRAVQRVVDEQQLHHPLLGLLGDRGRVLGLDDHAVRDRHRAAGLRLGHRPPAHLHLDQALAAGAGGVEQGVVAEPRDDDAEPLAGADDQLALRGVDLLPVDGEADVAFGDGPRLLFLLGCKCHPSASAERSTSAGVTRSLQ